MKEFDYLKEKKRMLDSIGRITGACVGAPCVACALDAPSIEFTMGNCNTLEIEYPEIATRELKKWSEAHPVKTRKDIFLGKLPHAMLASDGLPLICAKHVGLASNCPLDCGNDGDCEKPLHDSCDDCKNICVECWNTEVE
jgi:hypothetical protein